MDTDVVAFVMLHHLKKKQQEKKKKRIWSRDWLKKRTEESVAFRLVRELSAEDPDTFRQWTRLEEHQFQELLAQVSRGDLGNFLYTIIFETNVAAWGAKPPPSLGY